MREGEDSVPLALIFLQGVAPSRWPWLYPSLQRRWWISPVSMARMEPIHTLPVTWPEASRSMTVTAIGLKRLFWWVPRPPSPTFPCTHSSVAYLRPMVADVSICTAEAKAIFLVLYKPRLRGQVYNQALFIGLYYVILCQNCATTFLWFLWVLISMKPIILELWLGS